jgi:hypothetical protein
VPGCCGPGSADVSGQRGAAASDRSGARFDSGVSVSDASCSVFALNASRPHAARKP